MTTLLLIGIIGFLVWQFLIKERLDTQAKNKYIVNGSECEHRFQSYIEQGKERYQNEDFREAIRLFQTAYEIAPTSDLLTQIGGCYQSLKDYPNAIKALSDAISQNNKNSDAYGMRAACFIEIENYSKAIEDLTRFAQLEPDKKQMTEEIINEITLDSSTKKSVDPIDVLKDVIALLQRARDLAKIGNYKESEDIYYTILLIQNSPIIYVELARLNLRFNQNEKALSELSRGLSSFPMSAELLEMRAYLNMKMGNLDEAETDYKTLSESNPRKAEEIKQAGFLSDLSMKRIDREILEDDDF